jgi:lipid-A-disaccharide synthase
MSYKILVSAGEVSGDQHLARVVRDLRSAIPGCQVRGMAGKSCREAGVEVDVDCYRAGAGMGFFELFRSGGKILSSFRTLKDLLVSWKPDLLIVVDYPDFNLRLAKVAKRLGVKVLYFIPPKVWAWRSSRVRTIRRVVDQIAAIFPFERNFYEKHGYSQVTYVGNPLADLQAPPAEAQPRDNSILLLPGSRRFEVERMLVPMLRACEILQRRGSVLKPVVLLAPNISVDWVKSVIGDRVASQLLEQVRWSFEEPLTEMRRARVGVLKSGTCNLEGAIAGLPFVCVYSGTWFAKIVIKTFVNLKEYSPVNIVRSQTVREVMQVRLSPDDVVTALEPIMVDGPVRSQVIDRLRQVAQSLSPADSEGSGAHADSSVSKRVVRCIMQMLGASHAACCKAAQGAGDV